MSPNRNEDQFVYLLAGRILERLGGFVRDGHPEDAAGLKMVSVKAAKEIARDIEAIGYVFLPRDSSRHIM